jgi:hypothetical protein
MTSLSDRSANKNIYTAKVVIPIIAQPILQFYNSMCKIGIEIAQS